MIKTLKFTYISVFVLSSFFILSSKTYAFSGTGAGTSDSPYLITSCSQFKEIDDNPSQLAAYYKFNVSSLNCASEGSSIVIGTQANPFTGNFDGNDGTINISVSSGSTDYIGLFGYVEDAEIYDLTVTGQITTTAGSDYIGGLVGYAEDSSFTNTHSTVSLTTNSDAVGGLIGTASNTNITTSSHTSGTIITDGESSGGLLGELLGTSTLSSSYSANNTVDGYTTVGGLVGYNAATITNSYSNTTVSGRSYVGGFVGFNDGAISNSYSKGSVAGDASGTRIGGFVGHINDTSTISNSYTTSPVTVGAGVTEYGGFAGSSDNNNNYTNIGWYTGSGPTNAIGQLDGVGAVATITYNESSATAFNNVNHAIYSTWNFNTVWVMGTSPYLAWQDDSDDNASASREVFEEDERCVYPKPVELTWFVLKPTTKDGKSGMMATWTQYGADKVTIKIDNGSGTYPWVIEKTSNDGHEFLPNVSSGQKVKIKAYNECKSGEYSKEFSYSAYPNGWYNVK